MKQLTLLLVLLVALVTTPSGATTLPFTGDFSTGDFSQWEELQRGPNGCCTVGVKGTRTTVAYMMVEPGDKYGGSSGERAEVRTGVIATEGDVQHLEWSIYFIRAWFDGTAGQLDPTSGYWNTWTQFHHTGSRCSVPVSFDINAATQPYQLSLVVRKIRDYSACTFDQRRFDLGPIALSSWIHWDLYVTWSTDPDIGSIRVLRNGAEVVPETGLSNLYPGQDLYLKQGFYRKASQYSNAIYLDDTELHNIAGSVPGA